mmetsp:Transcript_60776/g.98377  ORF Transcript_60776/g.98377 Transcript_60776/m.98377 type:complete len:250 (-) Transcript_60776:463-1212(-)
MVGLGLPIATCLLQPLEVVLVLYLAVTCLLPHLLEQILLVNVNRHKRLKLGSVHLGTQVRQAHAHQVAQHLHELLVCCAHDCTVLLPRHANQGFLEVGGPNELDAQQRHLGDALVREIAHGKTIQDLPALHGSDATLSSDRAAHLVLQGEQPVLDVAHGHHGRLQSDDLRHGSLRLHDLHDLLAVDLVKLHPVDGIEELLEVLLDALRVTSLRQDLQQHWIGGEVEAGELVPLPLQITLQGLLALFQAF